MNCHLRKATRDDIPYINELFKEMLRSIYQKNEVQGYQNGDLEHYFNDSEDWICLAEKDSKIVGFLSIEVHREGRNFIYYDDFCVDAIYRNHGIGSSLLDEAERFANSIGFRTIVLHVEKENHAARRLYERRGFALYEEQGSRLCLQLDLQHCSTEG